MYVLGQGIEEVSRTDIGKKIKEGMEEAAKTAKSSAENVSKSGEKLGKTGAFRAISQVCSYYTQCGFIHKILLLCNKDVNTCEIVKSFSFRVFVYPTLGHGECKERDW